MTVIKTIGQSGQISLGKQFAGRHVLLDELEPGVWMLKLGEFIPDNEQWLHAPVPKASLHQAIEWAEENPPQSTNWAQLKQQID